MGFKVGRSFEGSQNILFANPVHSGSHLRLWASCLDE